MATGFCSILRGWAICECNEAGDEPFISFRRDSNGFRWDSTLFPAPAQWKRHPPQTAASAVYDFHYFFFDWFAAKRPDLFLLHAAAVSFPPGLVIFPSVRRAGKSTLVCELARRGLTVFCDDVLPMEIRGHSGMALGILPRLRLPLPTSAGEDYRAFVAARQGLSRWRWVYLALQDGELAPFGEMLPIAAIVALSRSPRQRPAKLSELPLAAALRAVIDRNFAEEIPPATIFDELREIAVSARCFQLDYSDVEDAAQCLVAEFGGPECPPSVRGSV